MIFKRIKELEEKVEKLEWSRIEHETFSHIPNLSCDTCGCLIALEKGVKGKSEIRTRKKYTGGVVWVDSVLCNCVKNEVIDEEYIHTPYYCRKCAPKELLKDK